MAKANPPAPPGAERREINAKFRSRMPHIFEELMMTVLKVEPHLKEAQIHVEEFRDFLQYEISKMELLIQKDAWESRVDAERHKADKQWLDDLRCLMRDASAENVMASTETLRDLFLVSQEVLKENGQSEDELAA